MKIAIDIDEVLANTIDQVLAFYKENYKSENQEIDLARPYFYFFGNTQEEANKKYFEFLSSKYPNIVEPVEGAQEAINELSQNNELIAVTGRPAFDQEKTEEWVKKYFPGKFERIVFNNDRTDIGNLTSYWGRSKAEICDEFGAEVLIDDLPKFMDNSAHLKVFVFDRPWNKDDAPGHAIRVKSWREIVQKLS